MSPHAAASTRVPATDAAPNARRLAIATLAGGSVLLGTAYVFLGKQQ